MTADQAYWHACANVPIDYNIKMLETVAFDLWLASYEIVSDIQQRDETSREQAILICRSQNLALACRQLRREIALRTV